MKHYVLTLLITFTISKHACSSPAIQWFYGSIVMMDTREVLTGEISVDETFNLVLFKSSEQVHVLQAHRLESIHFYDAAQQLNRKFVSLQSETGTLYKYSLYEIVVTGKVQLVRQLKNHLAHGALPSAVDYVYFIYMEAQLVPLQFFNGSVYNYLLERGGEELKQYQAAHRLNPNRSADAVKLIIQFNEIMRDEISESSMAVL